MNQNGIELQVCINGKPTREYAHEGQLFVEGRKGSSFTLRIRNHRAERANVVVLVDGINVVAGDSSLEKGYVVYGLSTCEIQGWRTSLNEVSTFIFKDKKGSYSKVVTGSDQTCGLISVVAFEEKKTPLPITIERVEHIHHHHYPRYDPFWWPQPQPIIWASTLTSAAATPVAVYTCQTSPVQVTQAQTRTLGAASTQQEPAEVLSLGTGWGPQKRDDVSEVEFQNGSRIAVMELYYSDSKGLAKMGIDLKKKAAVSKPALPTVLGNFCRPPE